MDPVVPARRFGPYLLTEKIGQGGMAQVWKACLQGPAGFEKLVVVKTIHPHLADQPEFVERFLTEARISSQLSHPNIVQVHDFGMQDGLPFLVLEHLEGHTVQQVLAAAHAAGLHIPASVATTIVRELCHGLGHAHEFDDGSPLRQSIVHGDVSPSNVMLCRDGSVKLIDFGVARIGGRYARFRNEALIGKCAYLAPEQVAFEPTDGRADVFAAGIVLHELLTMRRLFAGANDVDTLRRVGQAEVAPPSRHNADVPPALDAVVLKALARDPQDRYANAAKMAEALEQAEASLPPTTRSRLAAYLRELGLPSGNTGSRPLPVSSHTSTATIHGKRVPRPDVRPRRHRRRRGVWLAMAALVACMIAPCEFQSLAFREDVAPAVPVQRETPATLPAPVPEPEPVTGPEPVEELAPAPPPPAAPHRAAHPVRRKHHAHRKALRKGGLVDPFLCPDPSS